MLNEFSLDYFSGQNRGLIQQQHLNLTKEIESQIS